MRVSPIEPYQEVVQALRTMRKIASKAHGQDWHTVYETLPEEMTFVGIEREAGELVLESHDDLSDVDGEFIAMMDPKMAWFVISFLETAQVNIRQGSWSPYMQRNALEMARHLNRKYPEGK